MNHLMVAREGVVRLYRVNGTGMQEIATLKPDALPDDEELAIWAGALAHMASGPAVAEKVKPKALPAGKPKLRKAADARATLLAWFSDGEWHNSADVPPSLPSRSAWVSDCRKAIADGLLEAREELDETFHAKPGFRKGRRSHEYRLTEAGVREAQKP